MKDTKEKLFTPKPWVVTRDEERFFVNSSSVINSGHPCNAQDWICSVSVPKSGTPYSEHGHKRRTISDFRKALANATLISASPELLEACEAAYEWMANLGKRDMIQIDPHIQNLMSSAIFKALNIKD